ncbi:MAG: hypothetical protein ACOYXT_16045 [Bacteroidota bacterium]
MDKAEMDLLFEKINKGVKLAFERLIECAKKEDGQLIISKNSKIIRVKARNLK